MTIATIRSALADALDGIDDLRAVAYVTDQVNVYQAVVIRKEIDYDLVFARGGDTYNFTVRVYGPRAAEDAAQAFFDTLCEPSGATSIKTVLEADAVKTAAGVDYVRVRTAGEVGEAVVGDTSYLAIEFGIEVVV